MKGEKNITSTKRLRGPTLKLEIAKKRSEGVKIDIQYNDMVREWGRDMYN